MKKLSKIFLLMFSLLIIENELKANPTKMEKNDMKNQTLSAELKNIHIEIPSGNIRVFMVKNITSPFIQYSVTDGEKCVINEEKQNGSYNLKISKKKFLSTLFGEHCESIIEIQMPPDRNVNLNLKSDAGQITVEGVSGNHTIEGVANKINLKSITGQMNIHSTSLKLFGSNLKGTLYINGVSGSVNIAESAKDIAYSIRGTSVHLNPSGPLIKKSNSPVLVLDYFTIAGSLNFQASQVEY